jgi:hypothetical protein
VQQAIKLLYPLFWHQQEVHCCGRLNAEEGKAMIRELLALVLGGLLLTATGCEKRAVVSPLKVGGAGGGGMGYVNLQPAPLQRYVAERHEFEIITPESELQKSWESVIAFCATIQCEVISSSVTARTVDSIPSGTVSLRVALQDLTKLFAHIQKLGKIAQHTTEREDKTAAVVDTDARVKNLTAFRDNLRAMLAKPSATVKDLIDVQERLTETQSQLDSETANRKILANETEKIAVQLSFRVNEPRGRARGLALIWDALRESGSDLAESTAFLITVIVTVIPWLIVIVPALWLLARAWRKRRRNRTVSPAPSQATP